MATANSAYKTTSVADTEHQGDTELVLGQTWGTTVAGIELQGSSSITFRSVIAGYCT